MSVLVCVCVFKHFTVCGLLPQIFSWHTIFLNPQKLCDLQNQQKDWMIKDQSKLKMGNVELNYLENKHNWTPHPQRNQTQTQITYNFSKLFAKHIGLLYVCFLFKYFAKHLQESPLKKTHFKKLSLEENERKRP